EVAATARGRSFSKVADLKEKGAFTYELDVNAGQEDLHAIAEGIINDHGQVDLLSIVLVGRTSLLAACYASLMYFDSTNVFAPLDINRAFLPYMRERRTGTIERLKFHRSVEMISVYCATKHAVRALSVGVEREISPIGLRNVCFEPRRFRTNVLTADN
ncbi:hypothetical protein BC835DRAFT_1280071, partial [Cytidiella melzeri]